MSVCQVEEYYIYMSGLEINEDQKKTLKIIYVSVVFQIMNFRIAILLW